VAGLFLLASPGYLITLDFVNQSTAADPPIPPASRVSMFAATRWSLVLAAKGETPAAQDALSGLCQLYWYPLYSYVRRRGHSPEDAKDLTQEFFARCLAGRWIERAHQEKGRFRSFLLGVMNHFLADEWDKLRAQKRGGGARDLPLDFDTAETRFVHEPADNSTPEQIYERRWALTLLAGVLDQLGEEFKREGRGELFALLNPCLVGDGQTPPYAGLAKQLGVSEGTVKSAVHRMRQRYKGLVREAIAHTVAEPGEIEDELRHLFMVLAR
jgi:RNA polymerase sigma-70 factor (ECF subfamily)